MGLEIRREQWHATNETRSHERVRLRGEDNSNGGRSKVQREHSGRSRSP